MVARLKDASLSVILLVAVEGFRFPIDADEFDWRDPVKKAIPRAGRAGLSRSTQHLDRSSSPKVSKAASLVELGSERTRLGPRSVVPMKFQDSQLPKSSTPEPLAGHNSQSLGANLRILADNISSLLANIKSESEGYTGATPEPDYATCLKQNEKMRVVTQKMRVVHEALDDDIRSVLGLLSEMQPEKSDGSHKPKKEESDGSDKPKKEESDGSDKPKKEDPNAEDPNAAASGSTTLPAKDPNVAASGSTTPECGSFGIDDTSGEGSERGGSECGSFGTDDTFGKGSERGRRASQLGPASCNRQSRFFYRRCVSRLGPACGHRQSRGCGLD
eukprot:TRINITY_DN680_c0_g1_i9.p1 TRINITY_DN680_c0_g1~~TRINITY_DN680_c0_g1_i9.p1  ORF type:complete len:331 (+),score=58.05 TRINITY_DN680_c0_g1_i9:166-1158(+)